MDYKTLFTILGQQNGVYILVKDNQGKIIFISDEKARKIEMYRNENQREQFIPTLNTWYDVQIKKDETTGYTIETYYCIDFYMRLIKEANLHFVVKNEEGKILFCSDDISKKICDVIDPNKKTQYIESLGKWIRCEQGKATLESNLVYYLERYVEVTEYVEENKELKVDVLTGLYNRHGIMEQLHLLSDTNRKEFVVVIGDIDHFKSINDQYGHSIGDIVLKSVGSILNETVENGFCGRYGGEEFLIVLDTDDLEDSFETIEKIRKKIEQTEFIADDKTIHLTMSFGISKYNKDNCTKEKSLCISNIIETADIALLESKQSGRNKTLIYNETMLEKNED